MGRRNPHDEGEPFNMAYLALRGSGAINGVSQLHGRVSRHLFTPLFPRWPENEVPIGHVTNGVHMPTWDSAAADRIWTEACGQGRWLGTTEHLDAGIRQVSDETLWTLRDTTAPRWWNTRGNASANRWRPRGLTPPPSQRPRDG